MKRPLRGGEAEKSFDLVFSAVGEREIHPEAASLPHFRPDAEADAVLYEDALDDGEPQPRAALQALVRLARSVVAVPDGVELLLGDALACIDDLEVRSVLACL